MVNVSEEVKQLLQSDDAYIDFVVSFPHGERANIQRDEIVMESVSFTESLSSQQYLQFGLTEASVIEFETVGVENIVGYEIECAYDVYSHEVVGKDIYLSGNTGSEVAERNTEYASTGIFYTDDEEESADADIRYCYIYYTQDNNGAIPAYYNILASGDVCKYDFSTDSFVKITPSAELAEAIKRVAIDDTATAYMDVYSGDTGTVRIVVGKWNNLMVDDVFVDILVYGGDVIFTTFEDVYTKEGSVPLGRFVVDSCPRNHENMEHRQITAYSSKTPKLSKFEIFRQNLPVIATDGEYGINTLQFISILTQQIYSDLFDLRNTYTPSSIQYNSNAETKIISAKYAGVSNPQDMYEVHIPEYELDYIDRFVHYSGRFLEITANKSEDLKQLENTLLELFTAEFDNDTDFEYYVYNNNQYTNASDLVDAMLGHLGHVQIRFQIKENDNVIYKRIYSTNTEILVTHSYVGTLNGKTYDGDCDIAFYDRITANALNRSFVLYDLVGGMEKVVKFGDLRCLDDVSTMKAYVTKRNDVMPSLYVCPESTGEIQVKNNVIGKTYIGSVDETKLFNSILEFSGLFGNQQRNGSYELMALTKKNAIDIDASLIKSLWWNEYNIQPIGTVKYKVKIDDTEQIVNYQFGNGRSTYDMTNNYLLTLKVDEIGSAEDVNYYLENFFLHSIKEIAFTPVESSIKGLPYIEDGDYIRFVLKDNSEKYTGQVYTGSYYLGYEVTILRFVLPSTDFDRDKIIAFWINGEYKEYDLNRTTSDPDTLDLMRAEISNYDEENVLLRMTIYDRLGVVQTAEVQYGEWESVETYVMNHTISGIQALNDDIESNGGEIIESEVI